MWDTSVPVLDFLCLSVLNVGPMYATDRQTEQASKHLYLPLSEKHNNAKIYIKQADRLPERPKAINAGCPKLTDNTVNAMKTKKKEKKEKKKYIQMRDTRKAIRYTKFSVQ